MIKKSATPPAPSVPEETVTVPELNGEVLVRGLLLKDRLAIAVTDGYERMALMLAVCVFCQDDKGQPVPLYSADEWERFGSRHYSAAINLWDVTRRLSDIEGEAAEKKSVSRKPASPAASH